MKNIKSIFQASATFLLLASCTMTFFEPLGYRWEQVGDFSFGVGVYQQVKVDPPAAPVDADGGKASFAPRGQLEGVACRIPSNRDAHGSIKITATVFEDLNQDQLVQPDEVLGSRVTSFGSENSSVHFPSIQLMGNPEQISIFFELTSDLGRIQHVLQAP